MSTLNTLDLADAVEALSAASERALLNESSEDFELIERRISEFAATAREMQQAMWASAAKTAIRNLESNRPLTEADLQVIRALLVSDAEHYLAHENNYNDWVQELRRLFQDIIRRVRTVDRDSIADLRGVLKDAVRLVPNIRNYLDEQRRVKLFDQGLRTLDNQTRATLARLMKEQLSSPKL